MASQGPNSCGTGANVTVTGVSWSDPGNITSSDDSRAQSSLTGTLTSQRFTQYLVASNFGFSIPSGATIDGIVVEIERSVTSTSGSPHDYVIQLSTDGTISGLVGTNMADVATTWPTTDAYATYGGATNVWSASPTDTIVNSSGFSVIIRAEKTSGETSTTCRVDHVRMTVYYTGSTGGITNRSIVRTVAVNQAATY